MNMVNASVTVQSSIWGSRTPKERKNVTLPFLIGALVMLGHPAMAQVKVQVPMICGPAESVHKMLTDNHNESVSAIGTSTVGEHVWTMKLYLNPTSGRWTFAMLEPQGKALCIVKSGEDFKAQTPVQPSAHSDPA